MSEENVEVVRRGYAALTRGDTDTLRDLAAPEFVVDFSRRLVDPFVVRGRDEALGVFLSQSRDPWDDWPVWEPQEVIDADDKVVALIRFCARGEGAESRWRRTSGICRRFATGRQWSSSTSVTIERLPSKPPACRSRPRTLTVRSRLIALVRAGAADSRLGAVNLAGVAGRPLLLFRNLVGPHQIVSRRPQATNRRSFRRGDLISDRPPAPRNPWSGANAYWGRWTPSASSWSSRLWSG
jgi:ketosteroid isomerase-like protein